MRKKGETSEQDRAKPQPRQKKEREDARKKKKLDRVERQKSRQAQTDYPATVKSVRWLKPQFSLSSQNSNN